MLLLISPHPPSYKPPAHLIIFSVHDSMLVMKTHLVIYLVHRVNLSPNSFLESI